MLILFRTGVPTVPRRVNEAEAVEVVRGAGVEPLKPRPVAGKGAGRSLTVMVRPTAGAARLADHDVRDTGDGADVARARLLGGLAGEGLGH
ncbi:hypothetical protein, partial [Streptomyces altiplanensis]